MESLPTLAASPISIVLSGRSYLMTPLSLRDYGEIELAILDRAKPDHRVSPEEMANWMSSSVGLAYVLWLVLRTHQPEMTLSGCRALLASETDWGRIERELDRASGLPVGNCRGQTRRNPRTLVSRAA
ncbi:MAG: hypothetical protein HYX69_18695 [Planctomycetia bacterium]|nr:hypothetical protein [Planctomycetia bacterium]